MIFIVLFIIVTLCVAPDRAVAAEGGGTVLSADEVLRRAALNLQRNRMEAERLAVEGDAAMRRFRYGVARDAFRKAAELDPLNTRAKDGLAAAERRLAGQLDVTFGKPAERERLVPETALVKAKRLLAQATALPKEVAEPVADSSSAVLRDRLARVDAAIDLLQREILRANAAADNAESRGLRGEAAGRLAEARELRARLASALADVNRREARKIMEAIPTGDPNVLDRERERFLEAVDSLVRQERFEDAEDLLNDWLKRYPADVEVDRRRRQILNLWHKTLMDQIKRERQ